MAGRVPVEVPGRAAEPAPVLSVLSLVLGLLGAVTGLAIVGGVPAVAAVVLGIVARHREPRARALRVTGVVAGSVGIAAALVIPALYVAALVVGVLLHVTDRLR